MLLRQRRKRSRRERAHKPILSNKHIRRIVKYVKRPKRAKLTSALRKLVKQRKRNLQLLISWRTSMSKRRALLTLRGKGWGNVLYYLPLAVGNVGTAAVKAWPQRKQILSHMKNHAN